MPDSPANSTTARPIRRVSGWKVFGVFCLVCFLALLGVVFIPWDVPAPDDSDLWFTPPKLDADKNAFTYFEAASNLQVNKFLAATGEDRDWSGLRKPIGNSSEEWDSVFADEVLAANEPMFLELEKGLACEHYVAPRDEDFTTYQPSLAKYKTLVVLLALKSKRAQLGGDPVKAAQAACQGWRFGQLVTDNANSRIEWLVGIACQGIALARMNDIIADVKTPGPILRDLLAQQDRWIPLGVERGYKQAMQEDYRIQLTVIDQLPSRPDYYKYLDYGDSSLSCWARIPYFFKPNMTKRMIAPFYRRMITHSGRLYAKINLDYPGKPREPANDSGKIRMLISLNSAGKTLFFMLVPTLDRVIAKKCYLQSYVACLRLKIALRLYEQKHGKLPDDLNALVPDYLKEVPLDPYDGQPFRYSKSVKEVWAVGRNLKDDGGRMENDMEMRDSLGYDLVMPIAAREIKPNLATPSPSTPGAKQDKVNRVEQSGPSGRGTAAKP
jgi:hypothetical protein